MTLSEQIKAAEYVFYAKATAKKDVKQTPYGEQYTMVWTQECQPIKQPAQYLTPVTFEMPKMGDLDNMDNFYGSREVRLGFNYVFFARPGDEFGIYMLDEVNNQQGLYRLDDSNRNELAPYLNECLAGDQCFDDDDSASESWAPVSLADRVNDAEYVFKFTANQPDGTHNLGCIQCILKQPNGNRLEQVFDVNQKFNTYFSENDCQDYALQDGKTYIGLFERENKNGAVYSPNNLFPQEVNGQKAIYELTADVQEELDAMLSTCSSTVYDCAAEPEPDNGCGRVNLNLGVCAALGLYNFF